MTFFVILLPIRNVFPLLTTFQYEAVAHNSNGTLSVWALVSPTALCVTMTKGYKETWTVEYRNVFT